MNVHSARPLFASALAGFLAAGFATGLAFAAINGRHDDRSRAAAPITSVETPITSVVHASPTTGPHHAPTKATPSPVTQPVVGTTTPASQPTPGQARQPAMPPPPATPRFVPPSTVPAPVAPPVPATASMSAMQIADRYLVGFTPSERNLYATILSGMTPNTLQMALANLPHASTNQLQLLQIGLDFDMQLAEPLRSELLADLEGRLSPFDHQQLYVALYQIVASNAQLSAQIARLQGEVQASGEANACSLGGGTTVFTYRGAYIGCLP